VFTHVFDSRSSPRRDRRQSGFSVVELFIVISIMGILLAVAIPQTRMLMRNNETRTTAKSVADLVSYARSKAMQTGDPYLVFIDQDTAGDPLTMGNGLTASVLVVEDTTTEDCLITGGEEVWGVESFDLGIRFQRGTTVAQVASDVGRQASVAGTGTSFSTPANADASWILFGSDGIPRRFAAGTCDADNRSEIGRGGGVIYVAGALSGESLSNGRQYGVEITPLGAVTVHRYNWDTNAWRVR
jgi:prepilin-type N-terminal cleavage/methylation domain-containing protein